MPLCFQINQNPIQVYSTKYGPRLFDRFIPCFWCSLVTANISLLRMIFTVHLNMISSLLFEIEIWFLVQIPLIYEHLFYTLLSVGDTSLLLDLFSLVLFFIILNKQGQQYLLKHSSTNQMDKQTQCSKRIRSL